MDITYKAKITKEDYMRELKLTIENTELLYKFALSIVDFSNNSDSVATLERMAFEQIVKNKGGESFTVDLPRDKDVLDVMGHVSDTAYQLQRDAGE